MRPETLAVHAGAAPDAETGALSPPLHLSTTFEHAPDGSSPHGLIYQRYDNPTQQRLEQALGALDGAGRSLFFSTGMAAAATLLQALPAGGHVVFQDDLYHGIRVLAQDWLPRWGLSASFVDASDLDSVRAALQPQTCLIWAETPSNPLMRIVDIADLADIAHSHGAALLIDGTFATPALQQPLALGADVVLHSATKYLGGHSDVMGGVLNFARDESLAQRGFEIRKLHGASANPFAAWLVLRGIRSLHARMAMHCATARRVADFLATHPGIETVHYPGLDAHPGHAVAANQMRDFGGMLSLQVRGNREQTLRMAGALRLFHNATSLGGCESLVEHRASVEGPQPTSPQNLLRLSIGLEHANDLIEDLQQALESSGKDA